MFNIYYHSMFWQLTDCMFCAGTRIWGIILEEFACHEEEEHTRKMLGYNLWASSQQTRIQLNLHITCLAYHLARQPPAYRPTHDAAYCPDRQVNRALMPGIKV